MKRFKFLFFVITVIGLTACSSDDSTTVELTIDNFVGTYEITLFQGTAIESDISSSGNTSVVETTTITGDTFTDFAYSFSSDGTYTLTGSYRQMTVVSVNGQAQTDNEIEIVNESGIYTLNSTSRTITLDGEVTDITLFDGINLHLAISDTDTLPNGNTLSEQFEVRMAKPN